MERKQHLNNVRLFLLYFFAVAIICFLTVIFSACSFGDSNSRYHTHNLTYTAAVEATCEKNGNIEYWYCDGCKSYFADSKAEVEIKENTIQTYEGHSLNHINFKMETCMENGNIEYWQCKNCDNVFLDSEAKSATTLEDVIRPLDETRHTWRDNVCVLCNHDAGGSKGLKWSLETDGYYLMGIGTCDSSEIVIPSVHDARPVVKIYEYAFNGNSSITSVVIGEGIKEIGQFAFSGCTNLTSVTIGNSITNIGNRAFYNCTELTTLDIPNSVETIGESAFDGCTDLTTVNIGSGVKTVGSWAFENCSEIEKVNVTDMVSWCNIEFANLYANPRHAPNSLLYINNVLVSGDYEFPQGITQIPEYTLMNNPLTSVVVPNSVTQIGSGVFGNCESLTKLQLPTLGSLTLKSLFSTTPTWVTEVALTDATNIPADAFKNCTGLVTVTMPSTVTTINESAFEGCTNLTNVEIPSDIMNINKNAFKGCIKITSITIPVGIWNIKDGAFEGCTDLQTLYWNASDKCNPVGSATSPAFAECPNLKTVVFGQYVKKVPAYTFYGCTGIQSIDMTDTMITEIGVFAFNGCTGLNSISFYNRLKEIGQNAFQGCASLNGVSLPDTVTDVYSYAFSDCTSLTSMEIPEGVDEIWEEAFSGCTDLLSVTLPNGLKRIDKKAFMGCSRLASITIPENVEIIGYSAFKGCTSLQTVLWNAENCSAENLGAMNVENYPIFENCTNLTTVEFGAGVKTILGYLFYNCSSLANVKISASVTLIDEYAFYGCNLESVEFANTSGWRYFNPNGQIIDSAILSNPAAAAEFLKQYAYKQFDFTA